VFNRWVRSEIGSELQLWCTENVAQEAVGYLVPVPIGFLFSPAVIWLPIPEESKENGTDWGKNRIMMKKYNSRKRFSLYLILPQEDLLFRFHLKRDSWCFLLRRKETRNRVNGQKTRFNFFSFEGENSENRSLWKPRGVLRRKFCPFFSLFAKVIWSWHRWIREKLVSKHLAGVTYYEWHMLWYIFPIDIFLRCLWFSL
jgi:hypothetical protein